MVVILYQGMRLVDQCSMQKDATNAIIARSKLCLQSMLIVPSCIVQPYCDSGKLSGSIL